MSSNIKLFRFLYLVQEEIVREMDGRELINLYFLSARAKLLISGCRFRNVHTVIECERLKCTSKIQCRPRLHPDKEIIIEMVTMDSPEGTKSAMKFNGSVTIEASVIDREAERQPEEMRKLFRQKKFGETCNLFLKNMFRSSIENFAVHVSCKRNFDIFGERQLKAAFEQHNFVCDDLADLEEMWDHYAFYYSKKFPIENGSFPASIFLNKVRLILTGACQGVTTELLLQFNQTTAFLRDTNLNGNDFHLLIRNWYEGGQPNLNALILWQETPDSIDPATVLQDFEIHSYNEQQRARHYFLAPEIEKCCTSSERILDCKNGFDILRQDGKRCTVRIWRETVFCFYVWHQNFPSA
uniref:FBA_2 domain-containing protein n=2 Tax=Caenorhabditis tropicalis TaxID=1561998 RepID=A0A1I7URQ2_9PELO